MKQREYPENPDCPLTDQEKEELNRNLEDLEAECYFPFQHSSGGFSDATVYAVDEYEVKVEIKYGIDGEVEYTDTITIERPS
jgi:hypothetical protein